MNEGVSACAGGIDGACNVTYLPGYLWPGAVFLVVVIAAILLFRKKVSKNIYKIALIMWLVLLVGFTISVIINTETAGDRTAKSKALCDRQTQRGSSQAALCEY